MLKHKNPKWFGISRIDYKSTHGWFARVYMKDKQVISKLFSDKKCGGWEIALEMAREWRDKTDAGIAEELRPKPRRYFKKPPKNNTSGRVGISKTFSRSAGGKGTKIWCFSVSWNPEPKRPKCKSFYISQYLSEEAAFKAACQFREQMEQEIDKQEETKKKTKHGIPSSLIHPS